MSNIFYIVRHGQSEGNVNDDITGQNPPLTKRGLEQAEKLAQIFASIKLDQVFSSNMVRAQQTAKTIALSKNLDHQQNPLIRERFFGSLEGLPGSEIKANYQKKLDEFDQLDLVEQMKWRIVDNMESYEEVLIRVLPFFEIFNQQKQNQHILLVTHANVILALLIHFGFAQSFSQLPYGSIKNTGYIKVEQKANKFEITELLGISKIE